MPSSASDARETASGRLGGARADFVASLARKLSDARDLLTALEDEPSSTTARGELRRRLHALGSGARLLRFEAMARALQDILAVLDRGAQSGGLREADISFVAETLDDLPALAWGEAPPRDAAPTVTEEPGESAAGDTPAANGLAPVSVLIFGGEWLADALTEEDAAGVRAFECERTDDVQGALKLARAYGPDLVLLDGDRDGAVGLVEVFVDDPMTEPVPIIVVGSFRDPDEQSRFIALGVAKTLTLPVAPEVVRQACDEILDAREGRTVRIGLGEPTLEQLAERLSQELRVALTESVDPLARSIRVPLGEGTEVLGALWGAIARVQAIVTDRTKGSVRFGGDGPEGAIALAPWLHHDVAASDRSPGRGRGAAADVRLNGRRVVVADDDPGVTWFISDLLRTAGCEVHEALDGITARDLAFRVQPELVVSDILMPGLDGFALCRALRRDVALRDTPVMLLSWKEDLLQRVRELGASAAAYMRKESDSRAVLARVREVLRPRARIEMRLRGDGEVRGRLDDLSPRLLLELVGGIRRDARVVVRDASFLFEVEIRDGSPRKATRTASDGAFHSGERALAMLLAVGAGRFVVSPSDEPIRGELTGTLFELIARPLAEARGAVAATTGARTLEVERIQIDAGVLDEYLRATPDPARSVLLRLAGGASPRQMLLAGEVSPALFEDVLTDLSARCAIRGVFAADGTDMLTPAVDAALAVLTGELPRRSVLPPAKPVPPTRAPVAQPQPLPLSRVPVSQPRPSVPQPLPPAAEAPGSAHGKPAVRDAFASDPPDVGLSFASDPPGPSGLSFDSDPPARAKGSFAPEPAGIASATMRAQPPRPLAPHLVGVDSAPPPSLSFDDDDGPPSSLEDAVMREISDRSPESGALPLGIALLRPPIVEPSQLRPRSSNPPPPNRQAFAEPGDEQPILPSIPPDAVVPAAPSSEELAAAAPAALDPDPPSRERREREEGSEDAPIAAPGEPLIAGAPSPLPVLPEASGVAAPAAVETREPPLHVPSERFEPTGPQQGPRTGPSSDAAPRGEEPHAPRPTRWAVWLTLAAVVGAIAGGALRLMAGGAQTSRSAAGPTSASAIPSAPANAGASPSASAGTASSGSAAKGDDLPPGAEVPPGFGVLEIAAPNEARVRVDGLDAGRGPLSSSVLRAGYHQVRIDQDGRNTQYVIEVRAGKTTRVKSSPLP